jgi:hypothetical protein
MIVKTRQPIQNTQWPSARTTPVKIQQHKNTRIIGNDQQKGVQSRLKNCLKALHYNNNVMQHPSIS